MNKRSDSSNIDITVDAEIKLDGVEEFRSASLQLAGQAQRSLEIFSYDLDATLYDQQPFISAVRKFCLRSQFSQVRILLQNNVQVQKQGHRLVELVRKMPSSMEIRRPSSDYIDHQKYFLVVDQRAYLRWGLSKRYQGYVASDYRLKAQRLSDLFNEIWQCSQSDSELRRLYL